MKYYLAGLAALALTMPLWARVYKESLSIDKNKTIGSAQLKAGSYELSADDAEKELNILQNGKVIATVQGQWVKLPQKAQVLFPTATRSLRCSSAEATKRSNRNNPKRSIQGKRGRAVVRPPSASCFGMPLGMVARMYIGSFAHGVFKSLQFQGRRS